MTIAETKTVGFLHTAESHVPVFDQIARSLDSTVTLVHEVQPALLQAALNDGMTDDVIRGVNQSLTGLVRQGCTAISCTCSTLGEVVEDRVVDGVKVQRIDRAIANDLMQFDRVLVLSALETAAQAADRLLGRSARMTNSATHWRVAMVPGAWTLFETGDQGAYERTVADFANQFSDDYDAVFLSQASMLGAADLCDHGNVCTSPEAGVKMLLGL